jgi:AraC-like DNA-binding protein
MPVFFFWLNDSFVIFPATDYDGKAGCRIAAFTDAGWAGKSTIEEFSRAPAALVLRYTLRKAGANPMIFISTWLDPKSAPVDLSHYSGVSLRIKETTAKQVTLFIKTFTPGFTLPGEANAVTLRHNQYILHLSPGNRDYKIRFDNFVTPSWWINRMNTTDELLPREAFTRVVGFDLQFNFGGSTDVTEKQEGIVIEKLAFHKSFFPAIFVLPGLFLLYYAGLGMFFLRKKERAGKQTLPQGITVHVHSSREDELKRIIQFVKDNYHNPDISTGMIYNTLGIQSTRVFHLLKEEYRLSFKQLINKMRLEEAKRLLEETELKIIDIAFNLGFNDITYFNKLFKQEAGVTPSGYREKKLK